MISLPRVAVMGGSLAGLTAALALRDIGCDVTVYERAPAQLAGQGAGIVLNPATVQYLAEHGTLDLDAISVLARWVRYLDANGQVAHERPAAYRLSSYTALYRGLLDRFEQGRYRLGAAVEGFVQKASAVQVELAGGEQARYDLLVCADGIHSSARRQLLPGTALEYAGYIAWRGTVEATDLSAQAFDRLSEAIYYYLMPNSHLLTYPIPPAQSGAASQINWLWYCNVAAGAALDQVMTDSSGQRRAISLPPGAVRAELVDRLQADAAGLPALLAELVRATERPFIQAIVDLAIPRMAFGRACLIGDAAFVGRPHAAAGTAKAAADALALAAALRAAGGDVALALQRWEPGQLLLGQAVVDRTRALGRRVQFEGGWQVGDPLPFGLYAAGDSAMP